MGSRWDFVKNLGKTGQQPPEAVPLQPINKKPGDRSKDIELGEPAGDPGVFANIKTKLTTGLIAQRDRAKKAAQGTSETIQTSINFSRNMPYIIALGCTGIFFMIVAFVFLPLILLVPQKFSLAFALGGACFLGAIALVKEPSKFFKSLFEGELLKWSIMYFASIFGTLCSALIFRSKAFALGFAIAQIISLSYIIAVCVPGGKMILRAIKAMIRKCCSCFTDCILRR